MLALTAECGSLTVPENPDAARRPQDRSVRRARAGHQPQQEARSAVPDRGRSRARRPSTCTPRPPARSIACAAIATSSSLDQRGTGPLAPPRLRLRRPEPVRAHRRSRSRRRPTSSAATSSSKNSDLRMYTTSIAVRDLDARAARCSATSASTSTATPTARAWRSTTRAAIRSPRARVILDGVVNPEVVLGPAIAIDAERALERILERCARDAACAKAFTDPSADYRALRAQLAAKPARRPWSATSPPAGRSTSISLRGICPPCCGSPATTTTRPRCCRCRCTWRRTSATSRRSRASSACSRIRSKRPSLTACTTAWPAAKTRRSSMRRSSICAALNATHMGAEQVAAAHRGLQGLAEGRGR